MQLNYQTQTRLMQLSSSAFADDTFLVTTCTAVERLSALFDITISAFTTTPLPDPAQLIGKSVTLTWQSHHQQRQFNAIVAALQQHGASANGLLHYHLQLVPWLYCLQFTTNVRRYENQTVPDIITKLCQDNGFHAVDTSQLTQSYPAQPYTVQYNETAREFMQRLLHEQGMHYYFSHTANQHTLVLLDQFNQRLEPDTLAYANADNASNYIDTWQHQQQWGTQLLNGHDYHHDNATTELNLNYAVDNAPPIGHAPPSQYLQVPGNYANAEQGKHTLRHQVSQHLATLHTFEGGSNVMAIEIAKRFTLTEHPQQKLNQPYLVVSVTHTLQDNTYVADTQDNAQHYHNTFQAIMAPNAHVAPVSPHITLPKVSAQTALTAGNPQRTLTTDTLGRIKTQHYWQQGNDTQLTTHWASCLHPIAGKGWGSQFLPAVGSEQHVRYGYGKPNRPIIIGGLHHAQQLPYHRLPSQQNQWGISTAAQHYLNFDDTKAQERLALGSSHALQFISKQHTTNTVGNNVTIRVAHHYTHHSKSHSMHAKQPLALSTSGSVIRITPDKITLQGQHIALHKPPVAENVTTPPLPNTTQTTTLPKHWLLVHYPHLPKPYLPKQQSFMLSEKPPHQGEPQASFAGQLNPQAVGSVTLSATAKPNELSLSDSEIISLNSRTLPYPVSHVAINASDWQDANAHDLPKQTLTPGDKQLTITTLFPPIIKNLRQTTKNNASQALLTEAELAYFKHHGNNAMVFIHGFNVKWGAFPHTIDTLKVSTINEPNFNLGQYAATQPLSVADITYGANYRSVYCNADILTKLYPNAGINLQALPVELQTTEDHDSLNGSDAHNWFIHMEDNLNLATNQFQRDDYSQYTRCIHIAWAGDVSALNYLDAEPKADKAGEHLVALLEQLHNAGIAINAIAHSLGNRVLLRAMSILGSQGKPDIIDHTFLWEAAVPTTALSSNDRQTLLDSPADRFLHASDAAKKITVLFSKHDDVLKEAYYFAKYSGLTLHNIPERYWARVSFEMKHNISMAEIRKAHQALFTEQRCLGMVNQTQQTPLLQQRYHEACQAVYAKMAEYHEQETIAALGFDGLDSEINEDAQVTQLVKDKKIMRANMTPYSTGHSYMRIPSAEVMKRGYQKWIITKSNPDMNFGLYNASQFPEKIEDT
jgi:type VI secretion system secreted protein VgrG